MEIDELFGTASTSGTSGREAQAALGREDFLKMLLAQLEHQDPLDPMDGTEFTAQLATFSMLEELIEIRNGIGRLEQTAQNPPAAAPVDLPEEVVA